MIHLPFPCSDPVRAGNAGNIPAGIVYSFSVHGIWENNNSTGTENNGKTGISTGILLSGNGNIEFLRQRLGWEWAIHELVGWDNGNDS